MKPDTSKKICMPIRIAAWLLCLATAWAPAAHAEDLKVFYRKLDRLQALGVGLSHQQQPTTMQPDRRGENTPAVTSFAGLIQSAERTCGGPLIDWPEVGMSDETFRICTRHAHFGNLVQVVASQEGGRPLRLYVFASERAHKVYAVDGVVTAILP
jgi:hypothetical protein